MERSPARWQLYLVHAFTLSRLLFSPFVAWAIVRGHPLLAGWLCGIAGATDALDGGLARKFHATSRAGQYLDPISDKVLLSAVYVALAWIQSIPWALVILIFSRDLALLLASAIAMRFTTYNNYRPTIWGKISTFVQIVTAVALLASNASGFGRTHNVLHAAARFLIVTTAAATVWSAVHYTWRGIAYFRRR
ncbi:MAG: CDP-alcohol phosphatidyltransferase family protein [Acidobacteriota bacterium]|nr:CDP-alcohol phosphatidyltransferase family protein [Acidobacteriota bacterium]